MNLVDEYRHQGFVVVPDFVQPEFLAELKTVTHDYRAQVRAGAQTSPLFDTVEGTDGVTDLRRITDPEQVHDVYLRFSRLPKLIDLVADLLDGTVRFDHAKLNFKAETDSSAVQWHQDWAFSPMTNDDMLVVGVMIDDCTEGNGAPMVVPGSHHGPLFSHHHDGFFVGGIRSDDIADQIADAVPVTGQAGSIFVLHVRTLHGSAPNRGTSPRPLLLSAYTAVDSFPICHSYDWDDWDARILRGEPTVVPRIESLPVRIPHPAPPADHGHSSRSLFELQLGMADTTYG